MQSYLYQVSGRIPGVGSFVLWAAASDEKHAMARVQDAIPAADIDLAELESEAPLEEGAPDSPEMRAAKARQKEADELFSDLALNEHKRALLEERHAAVRDRLTVLRVDYGIRPRV